MEDMNENSKRKRRKTFWCFFFDRSKMKILTAILFLLGPGKKKRFFFFKAKKNEQKISLKIEFGSHGRKIKIHRFDCNFILSGRDVDGNEVSQFTTRLQEIQGKKVVICALFKTFLHTGSHISSREGLGLLCFACETEREKL